MGSGDLWRSHPKHSEETMRQEFTVLDRNLPVHQSWLLEASAGTGKTFSIENIFVRLLIGEDHKSPISLPEILVVSFTKATAAELRARIRENLMQAYRGLSSPGISSPDYIQAIIEKGEKEVHQARVALQQALLIFDDAQIFTIHSFCKKMLEEAAFSDVSQEQISPREVHQIISDFFRVEGKKYSPAQLELVLHHYRQEFAQLEQALADIIIRGGEVVSGKSYAELFHEFRDEIKTLSRKYVSSQVLEDFFQMASSYKGLHDRHKVMKKEIVDEVSCFAQLFDRTEWNLEDFDQLISTGIPFFTLLDPSQMIAKAKPIKPGVITADLHRLQEIVHEARDVEKILCNMANDCQKRLKAYLESEEKFRYDDLLQKMWEACSDPQFVQNVSLKYRAVIIDEFQDTDLLQWMIFRSLFFQRAYVYLVGDPKQSIYSFRQADIYTYFDAAATFGENRTASLSVNYRSQPDLVEAFNQLFSRSSLLVLPKKGLQFPYFPVKYANREAKETLGDHKGGVHFILYEEEQGNSKTWPTSACEDEYFFPYLVGEIFKLNKEKQVKYSEWAVLVRDRNQARHFIQYCKEHNLPVASQWQKGLSETPAFETMKDLLRALLHPHDTSALKSLLLHRCCTWTIDQLLSMTDEEHAMAKAEILNLRDQWEEKGFSSCYLAFLDSCWKQNQQCVFEEMLQQEGGIEFIHEFQQLADYLIGYENAMVASSEVLYQHLCDLPLLYVEEQSELFFKDDLSQDAVKVITIHMSKGLEFPYVVALGLAKRHSKFQRQMHFERVFEYRQSSPFDKDQSALEEDAEKMRQLYVAFTRAKNRLYVPIPIQTDRKLPLKPGEPSPLEIYFGQMFSHYGDMYENISQISAGAICQFLDSCNPQYVTYEKLEKPISLEIPQEVLNPNPEPENLEKPEHFTIPGRTLYIKSFSSLAQEHDVEDFQPPLELNSEKNRHTLPLGANTGILIHQILEEIPFQLGVESRRGELLEHIRHIVQGTHLQNWEEIVTEMVCSALSQPIFCNGKQFRLCEIPLSSMFKEIEFLYPCPPHLVNRSKEVKADYLRGVIDLIFAFEGKYYLIDWKTNWLGPSIECYTQAQMKMVMEAKDYYLQAAIYRDAFQRYLHNLDPRPFETCFGGTLYFFVRGSDISTVNAGVYQLYI